MIDSCEPVIVGISDVSLGYGSPQMPTLLESLAEHYGAHRAVAIEPDQSERPPVPHRFPRLELKRLSTAFHNFSISGFVEYNSRAIRLVNEMQPDVLVITSSSVLPSVLKLRQRPKVTIYYMLEGLDHYMAKSTWRSLLMLELNRQAAKRIDMAIFPEENRAAHDFEHSGLKGAQLVVCYNAVNRLPRLSATNDAGMPPAEGRVNECQRSTAAPLPRRRMRILYSGTIDRRLTSADYYLHADVQDIPIDMWGIVDGPDRRELERALQQQTGQVRYRGYIDSVKLAEIRLSYAYSIVMWAPVNRNTLYACPNKLFEAIADGVPPIAAPHPQCKMLLERYQCGILMQDWSFKSFLAALRRASAIFGTAEYDRLVENCRRATEVELNWDRQFEKVRKHLPSTL